MFFDRKGDMPKTAAETTSKKVKLEEMMGRIQGQVKFAKEERSHFLEIEKKMEQINHEMKTLEADARGLYIPPDAYQRLENLVDRYSLKDSKIPGKEKNNYQLAYSRLGDRYALIRQHRNNHESGHADEKFKGMVDIHLPTFKAEVKKIQDCCKKNTEELVGTIKFLTDEQADIQNQILNLENHLHTLGRS